MWSMTYPLCSQSPGGKRCQSWLQLFWAALHKQFFKNTLSLILTFYLTASQSEALTAQQCRFPFALFLRLAASVCPLPHSLNLSVFFTFPLLTFRYSLPPRLSVSHLNHLLKSKLLLAALSPPHLLSPSIHALVSHLFPSCRRRAGCSCRGRRSICRSRGRSWPRSLLLPRRSCLAGFHASSRIAVRPNTERHTVRQPERWILLNSVNNTDGKRQKQLLLENKTVQPKCTPKICCQIKL